MNTTLLKAGLLICALSALCLAPAAVSAQDEAAPLCDTSGASAKGDRVLGLDFLDLSGEGTFLDNLNRAVDLGVTSLSFHVNWDQIEVGPGQYTDPGNALAMLQNVVPASDMKLNLTIRPIDATGRHVPEDLIEDDFDRARMAQRFIAMLEYVFSIYDPTHITSIQIGNEIDLYDISNESASFWEDYTLFLQRIRAHVNLNFFGTKIGFTATLPGLTSSELAADGVFHEMAEVVDVIGVTYYPIDGEYQVRPFDDVYAQFDALDGAFPESGFAQKEIHIQEIGFPTSSLNDSSDEQQAQFFCNAFKAWDQHRERFGLMNIVRMQDLSFGAAQDLAALYGDDSSEFSEYLRTLGLRIHNGLGQDKPAYQVVSDSAAARGW